VAVVSGKKSGAGQTRTKPDKAGDLMRTFRVRTRTLPGQSRVQPPAMREDDGYSTLQPRVTLPHRINTLSLALRATWWHIDEAKQSTRE
jgi:hypothetical protein